MELRCKPIFGFRVARTMSEGRRSIQAAFNFFQMGLGLGYETRPCSGDRNSGNGACGVGSAAELRPRQREGTENKAAGYDKSNSGGTVDHRDILCEMKDSASGVIAAS